MRYTKDYSAEIERLKEEIQIADAIVIGAGAGLSTAAGFTYSGERLQKYFVDFVSKYGFKDMYSGGGLHEERAEQHHDFYRSFHCLFVLKGEYY